VSCKDVASRDFRDSDYVRFYFDLEGDARRRGGRLFDDDLCVVFTPTSPLGRPMVKFPRYEGDPFRRPLLPSFVEVASRIFKGGYVVEARLPADSLDIAPREGLRCGFQLVVGDTDDGEREAEMAWSREGNYWFDPRSFGEVEFCPPLPVRRLLELAPQSVRLDLLPNLLLLGDWVAVRLLSLLPGTRLKGRLLLRRPGEGAVSKGEAEVPFGKPVDVRLDARSLPDGRFLLEFECLGFVKSEKGVCLRGLWREALALKGKGRGEIEGILGKWALEALEKGRPDSARRALERLLNLLGQQGPSG